jgi:DNA-binding protein H-NS
MVRAQDYSKMSLDDLWRHHDFITKAIRERTTPQLRDAVQRRDRIEPRDPLPQAPTVEKIKSAYPRVRAKYRNPKDPLQTWSGRGYKPKWLTAFLASGHSIDEFIARPPGPERRTKSKV